MIVINFKINKLRPFATRPSGYAAHKRIVENCMYGPWGRGDPADEFRPLYAIRLECFRKALSNYSEAKG